MIFNSTIPFFVVLGIMISGILYVVVYEIKYSQNTNAVSLLWIIFSILIPLITPLVHLIVNSRNNKSLT